MTPVIWMKVQTDHKLIISLYVISKPVICLSSQPLGAIVGVFSNFQMLCGLLKKNLLDKFPDVLHLETAKVTILG